MGEDNLREIPQIPVEGGQKAAEETSLREELARVRSRGRAFKIAAAIFGLLFMLLVIGGYIVYRKVSQAKAMLEAVSQGFMPIGAGIPTGQKLSEGGEADADEQALSTSGPAAQQLSGLGLLSMPGAGSAPQVGGLSEADMKQRADAGVKLMKKYAERPIIKQFLAELQDDPDFARAKKEIGTENPMALIGAMRKSKTAKAVMMKYAQKPEFMKALMDMSRDPELKQFSGGGAVSVPAMPQLDRAAQPAEGGEEAGDEPGLSFDASAISGTAAQPAKNTVKTPPAIDSGK